MADTATILASGGLAAAVCIGWELFRTRLKASVEHEYKGKQEEQQKETQKELARLNSELERLTTEQTFRFSHVFQKTEEAIATIYKHLVDIHEIVRIYTIPGHTYSTAEMNDYRTRISDVVKRFQEYWYPNKIYLRKHIAKRIVEFTNVVSHLQITNEISTMLKSEQPIYQIELKDMLQKSSELKRKSEQLLSELEDEFQEVLGFPIDTKPHVN